MLPFVLWVLAVTLAIAAVVAWIKLRKISVEMAGSETARFLEEPASVEIAPAAEGASTEEFEGSSVRPEALERGIQPGLRGAELRVGEADLAPAIKGLDRTIGEEARRTSKEPADASASICEGTRTRFHNEPSAARAAFGASAAALSDPHLPTPSDDSESAVIEFAHEHLGGFQTKASQHQPESRVWADKVVTPPSGDGGVPVLEHLQENWRVVARSRKPEPSAGAATEQLPAIEQAQAVEAKFGERGQRLQGSDKLLKSEAAQPKKQAEETAQRLTGKLRTSEMEFIEHAERRLAGLTQTSLESLSQEAKAIASECGQGFRQHLDRLVVVNPRPVEAKPGGVPEQKWLGARNDADARWTGFDGARGQFVRASPRHRASDMPAGLNLAIWLVAMITTLVLLFIVLSVNPITQLLPDPPAEFFEQRPDWTARRRVTEERLARAYWEWAVRNLQSKYKSGAELPTDPPVGFQVEGAAGAQSLNGDSEARIRYWGRLRRVWTLPQAWRKSYVWSTKWIDLIFRPGGRETRQ